MKILVTGFEPFGKDKINPSSKVLEILPKTIGKNQILTLELPTVRRKAIMAIEEMIEKEEPDILLSLGQAGGIDGFHIEKVAINYDDFRIPDNEGNQPIDESIYEDGETAYFATLPVKRMLKELELAGFKGSLSYSAGTFVCNHVFYGGLYLASKKYNHMKCGFIHLPYIAEQVEGINIPSMSLDKMLEGMITILKVIDQEEVQVHGGEIF